MAIFIFCFYPFIEKLVGWFFTSHGCVFVKLFTAKKQKKYKRIKRVNTGCRKCKCSECGKCFRTRQQLTQHRPVHSKGQTLLECFVSWFVLHILTSVCLSRLGFALHLHRCICTYIYIVLCRAAIKYTAQLSTIILTVVAPLSNFSNVVHTCISVYFVLSLLLL